MPTMSLKPRNIDFHETWSTLKETVKGIVGLRAIERAVWNNRFSDVYALCVAYPEQLADKLLQETQKFLEEHVTGLLERVRGSEPLSDSPNDDQLLHRYHAIKSNFIITRKRPIQILDDVMIQPPTSSPSCVPGFLDLREPHTTTIDFIDEVLNAVSKPVPAAVAHLFKNIHKAGSEKVTAPENIPGVNSRDPTPDLHTSEVLPESPWDDESSDTPCDAGPSSPKKKKFSRDVVGCQLNHRDCDLYRWVTLNIIHDYPYMSLEQLANGQPLCAKVFLDVFR